MIPKIISVCVFKEIDKINLKFIWKNKGYRTTNTTWNRGLSKNRT